MTFESASPNNSSALSSYTRKIGQFRIKLEKLLSAKSPTSVLMNITPEMASVMFEYNVKNNRNTKPAKINTFASEMKELTWLVSSQGIGFNVDGLLFDGQNRLLACMKADTPFETWVFFGLPSKAFLKVDQGTQRTASDIFHIEDISNASMAAAAAKIFFIIHTKNVAHGGGISSGGAVMKLHLTPTKLLEILSQNKGILDSCKFVCSLSKDVPGRWLLAPSILAGLHFMMVKKDSALAAEFIAQIATGADLPRKHPVFKLRNKLMEPPKQGGIVPSSTKTAFVVKTWNKVREGGRIEAFHWNASEDFPRIR